MTSGPLPFHPNPASQFLHCCVSKETAAEANTTLDLWQSLPSRSSGEWRGQ